jgi:uncharacterized protein YecT (DUF1311 family)
MNRSFTRAYLLLALMFVCRLSYSQSTATAGYEGCVKKGRSAASCYKTFYARADSMLNSLYAGLSARCNDAERENLKDEQRFWLRHRDRHLKASGPSAAHIRFVEERIAVLSSKKESEYSDGNYAVDPAGSFQLVFGKSLGAPPQYPSGKIRVERISPDRVFVNLHYAAGPPANGLGIIKDTLVINGSTAEYRTPEDTTCLIRLRFMKNGIRVEQWSQAFSFGCGFGRNVHIDGFYERALTTMPTIRSGNHKIAVQWIGWEKPGTAVISKLVNGTYRINGSQLGENRTDYLKVDGTLEALSADKLVFNGVILLKYGFINGGNECRREGRYNFTAPAGKKYWRLEEMGNCEGGMVTDYIDLFF